jgi:hypothetical protein
MLYQDYGREPCGSTVSSHVLKCYTSASSTLLYMHLQLHSLLFMQILLVKTLTFAHDNCIDLADTERGGQVVGSKQRYMYVNRERQKL